MCLIALFKTSATHLLSNGGTNHDIIWRPTSKSYQSKRPFLKLKTIWIYYPNIIEFFSSKTSFNGSTISVTHEAIKEFSRYNSHTTRCANVVYTAIKCVHWFTALPNLQTSLWSLWQGFLRLLCVFKSRVPRYPKLENNKVFLLLVIL